MYLTSSSEKANTMKVYIALETKTFMSGKIKLIKRFLAKWNVAETASIGITQIAPRMIADLQL